MAHSPLPDYPLAEGRSATGFESFAQRLLKGNAKVWLIDGTSGMDWRALRANLQAALDGHTVVFLDVHAPRRLDAIRREVDGAAGEAELVLCIGQGSALLPVKAARACVWSAGILPAPGCRSNRQEPGGRRDASAP